MKAANGEANINDLVMFCVIQALLQAPTLNAEYIDGKFLPHAEVHLGFACDTPARSARPRDPQRSEATPSREFARQSKDLAARAIEAKISPDELAGATFT
jgi:pyruvate dehydrogenase E2 component (dihydrolipoamide acetyltransferase)